MKDKTIFALRIFKISKVEEFFYTFRGVCNCLMTLELCFYFNICKHVWIVVIVSNKIIMVKTNSYS